MTSVDDQVRSRMVRVMLQLSDRCTLPDYVPDPEYFPFGLATASVPFERLGELEQHPGVLAQWLQSEERLAQEPRSTRPVVELRAPSDVAEPLVAVFPGLVRRGARQVEVFEHGRPGEQTYWLAFILTVEGRHTVGTPDLRHLALADQVPELLRQLAGWRSS